MGSKAATVLRIFATACVWNSVSSFSLNPHKREFVPSFTRSEECYCRQQTDSQFQCWQLNKLSLTRLYEGTTETEPSSIAPDARKALSARISSNSQSPDDTDYNTRVNGSNANELTPNGSTVNGSNGFSTSATNNGLSRIPVQLNDIPQPTANGGFSHTAASKAKIAAANKGKTPWNKGKTRSEEVKARIAAGVRARNRERFLQKLKDEGITEEEYNSRNAAAKARKEAEKNARRTAKGGYRPTAATKAKISKIMKEKHARGEIKPRTVDPNKVRRGFTHSEETRAKISASLKQRWANDSEYRENMKLQALKSSNSEETRKRISETLKKKWKDPEFRSEMMEKLKSGGGGGSNKGQKHNDEHKRKISEAMKRRWQDETYREKLMESISKRKPPSRKKTSSKDVAVKGSAAKKEELSVVKPLKAGEAPPKKKKRSRKKRVVFAESEEDVIQARQPKPKAKNKTPAKKKEKKKKEPDGSVNRLREESRDLFDLLYGDEDSFDGDADEEEEKPVMRKPAFFEFGDEDLDAFDPYGLEDY